jgi:hypothetical protein
MVRTVCLVLVVVVVLPSTVLQLAEAVAMARNFFDLHDFLFQATCTSSSDLKILTAGEPFARCR